MGSKGPRKMKVIIPDIKSDGSRFEFKPINVLFYIIFIVSKI